MEQTTREIQNQHIMTTRSSEDAAQVWIGLACLKGDPSNPILDGCYGAYSTFLAFSHDRQTFEESVKEEVRRLGLQYDGVLWSEPLNDRIHRFGVEDYLVEIASKLLPGEAGVFGRFHAWEREE
jgi:hypothetical protein